MMSSSVWMIKGMLTDLQTLLMIWLKITEMKSTREQNSSKKQLKRMMMSFLMSYKSLQLWTVKRNRCR